MNWLVVLHYRRSLSFLVAIFSIYHWTFRTYVTCIQPSQVNNVLMWVWSLYVHTKVVFPSQRWHNSTSFIYKKLSKLKINVLYVIWASWYDLPFLIKHSVITFAFFTARTQNATPAQHNPIDNKKNIVCRLYFSYFCSFWIQGHTNIRPPATKAGLEWQTPAKENAKKSNLYSEDHTSKAPDAQKHLRNASQLWASTSTNFS